LARRVRAFQPWPVATTIYRGELLSIHEAWPVPLAADAASGTVIEGDRKPLGAPLEHRRARAVVVCGTGGLALLRIQRPGKRPIEIEDYLNGDREFVGALIG
jgi:methionyl-tRNA formyltransferase